MFAQSLLEYGFLSAVTTAIGNAVTSVRNWADESPEQVWILVAVLVILGMLWLRNRK
jgi:hypothetical protein